MVIKYKLQVGAKLKKKLVATLCYDWLFDLAFCRHGVSPLQSLGLLSVWSLTCSPHVSFMFFGFPTPPKDIAVGGLMTKLSKCE